MHTLGQRLKAERYRLNYSLDEFAAIGGIGRSTQARYEADERIPGVDYIARLRDAGVETDWVMTGVPRNDQALMQETEAMMTVWKRKLSELEYRRTIELISKAQGPALPPRQVELLNAYALASDEGKAAIERIAQLEAATQAKSPDKPRLKRA